MQVHILGNVECGRGNRWLTLQVPGESPLDHAPGTVLGLAFRHGNATLRHAYTVSRADPARRTLEFLYRVIPHGRMTPHLAALGPGDELTLSGRGGHPIPIEVDTLPAGIVLVSTGSGIGPNYGYSRMALEGGSTLPITLLAGFREAQDACLQTELEALALAHPNFHWQFSLSRPNSAWKGLRGRISESMAQVLGPVGDLHFHLIGNGSMVVELYQALRQVGLPEERVTSEVYFNYPDTVDTARVERIAAGFRF